jgi:hypothetical protein
VAARRIALVMAATLLGAEVAAAQALVNLGSIPLLCAMTSVLECSAADGCQRVAPDAVNLPHFLAVDVPGQVVAAQGNTGRQARIERVQRTDGRIVLQGGQDGRAWTMLIGDAGALSGTVVDHDAAFTVFGRCTTAPAR